jgi:hypothetical protein
MSQPALTYEMYDDRVLLGVLTRVELLDWPWFSADFHPTPEYVLYRARLDAELRSDAEAESLEELEIEPLVLTLFDPEKGKTGSALLYDEGDWMRFRVSFD